MKKELTITIDLQPIIKDIEKYIKRKLIEEIRSNIGLEPLSIDFPNIHFPEIEKRLEKLEDWKNDYDRGFLNPKPRG